MLSIAWRGWYLLPSLGKGRIPTWTTSCPEMLRSPMDSPGPSSQTRRSSLTPRPGTCWCTSHKFAITSKDSGPGIHLYVYSHIYICTFLLYCASPIICLYACMYLHKRVEFYRNIYHNWSRVEISFSTCTSNTGTMWMMLDAWIFSQKISS